MRSPSEKATTKRTGKKLVAWRKARALMQSGLAKAAGIEQSALSQIERGDRTPSNEQAFRLQIVTGGHVDAREWIAPSALGRLRPLPPVASHPEA